MLDIHFPLPYPSFKYAAWQKTLMDMTEPVIYHSSKGARFNIRNIVVCGGAGSGKDIVSLRIVLRSALALWAFKKTRKDIFPKETTTPLVKVFLCAPRMGMYKQLESDFKSLLNQVADFHGLEPKQLYHYTRGQFQLFRSSKLGNPEIEIEMVSLWEGETIRGKGVDICHITEAAFLDPETEENAWTALKGRQDRPGRVAQTILVSTPNGKDNEFYRLWKRLGGTEDKIGKSRKMSFWKSPEGVAVQVTSMDSEFNASQAKSFNLDKVKDPVMYYRERCADFTLPLSGIHNSLILPDAHKHLVSKASYSPNDPMYCGLDIAGGCLGDYTALTVFSANGQLVWAYRENETPPSRVIKLMEETLQRFPKIQSFICDSTSHIAGFLDIARNPPHSLPIDAYDWRGQRKMILIQKFQATVNLGYLKIPDPENYTDHNLSPEENASFRKHLKLLLKEWSEYHGRIKPMSNGQVVWGNKNVKDDLICSLLMAALPFSESVDVRSRGKGQSAYKPPDEHTIRQVDNIISNMF